MGDTCLPCAADLASVGRLTNAPGSWVQRRVRPRGGPYEAEETDDHRPAVGRSPSAGSLHTPGRLNAQVQDARDPLAQVRNPLQQSSDEPQQTMELPQCARRLPQRALDRLAAATAPADAGTGPTAAVVVHRNLLIGNRLANGFEGLAHCAEAGHHHREGWSPPSRRLVTTTAHVGPPSANAMPPTAAARSRRPQAGPPGAAVAHPHCSGDSARR